MFYERTFHAGPIQKKIKNWGKFYSAGSKLGSYDHMKPDFKNFTA